LEVIDFATVLGGCFRRNTHSGFATARDETGAVDAEFAGGLGQGRFYQAIDFMDTCAALLSKDHPGGATAREGRSRAEMSLFVSLT
jgi:hypothetical protein